MIGALRGALLCRLADGALIECHGVAYVVALTSHAALPAESEEVFVWVHTHVREEQIALFGFTDPFEKEVFEMLIGVSGVGPKMAMNLLSGISAAALVRTLAAEDAAALTKISGVGKKTAERLIVELKGAAKKLSLPVEARPVAASRPAASPLGELVSALVNLGYRQNQVESVVERLVSETPELTIELGLREALRRLRTS